MTDHIHPSSKIPNWTIIQSPTVKEPQAKKQDSPVKPEILMKQALIQALLKTDEFGQSKFEKIAEALVASAEEGTISSIKEIIDRIDGKNPSLSEKNTPITIIVDTGITREKQPHDES